MAPFAPFGCSVLFDTWWTIFFTGSKLISPLDIHIRVWGGDIRPYLIGSSLFKASTTIKTSQEGPFLAAVAWLTPHGPFLWLDLSGSHSWTFTLGCEEVISGHLSLDPAFLQPLQPSKQANVANFGPFWLLLLGWHLMDHFFGLSGSYHWTFTSGYEKMTFLSKHRAPIAWSWIKTNVSTTMKFTFTQCPKIYN